MFMMKKDQILHVGIIGTGWIAEKAAITLNGLSTCEAYAVGSRTAEKAKAFAAHWRIGKAYGSYQELIDDPNVDLVYVGTPHSHHYDVTRASLLADKPCLVENGHAISLLWRWFVTSSAAVASVHRDC